MPKKYEDIILVEIKRNGELHMTPKGELQAYALRKWVEDNLTKDNKIDAKNILFHYINPNIPADA